MKGHELLFTSGILHRVDEVWAAEHHATGGHDLFSSKRQSLAFESVHPVQCSPPNDPHAANRAAVVVWRTRIGSRPRRDHSLDTLSLKKDVTTVGPPQVRLLEPLHRVDVKRLAAEHRRDLPQTNGWKQIKLSCSIHETHATPRVRTPDSRPRS